MLAALLGAVMGAGAAAQDGLPEDYQPLVEPIMSMIRGCLEQGYDQKSFLACHDLSKRACLAMGPSGDTTQGRVMCAWLLGAQWDRELESSLQEVLAALGPEAAALREEQVAWAAYWEAACAFAVAEVSRGSMAAHVGGECHVRMAAERVAEFRETLRYQ